MKTKTKMRTIRIHFFDARSFGTNPHAKDRCALTNTRRTIAYTGGRFIKEYPYALRLHRLAVPFSG